MAYFCNGIYPRYASSKRTIRIWTFKVFHYIWVCYFFKKMMLRINKKKSQFASIFSG